ncbi:hypothetical protein DEV91_1514 [Phyllobacterium brassicacearum]|nr:hypothetical protein DEV91_1514 [Phyllobacterium brassicacearum]
MFGIDTNRSGDMIRCDRPFGLFLQTYELAGQS